MEKNSREKIKITHSQIFKDHFVIHDKVLLKERLLEIIPDNKDDQVVVNHIINICNMPAVSNNILLEKSVVDKLSNLWKNRIRKIT